MGAGRRSGVKGGVSSDGGIFISLNWVISQENWYLLPSGIPEFSNAYLRFKIMKFTSAWITDLIQECFSIEVLERQLGNSLDSTKDGLFPGGKES